MPAKLANLGMLCPTPGPGTVHNIVPATFPPDATPVDQTIMPAPTDPPYDTEGTPTPPPDGSAT